MSDVTKKGIFQIKINSAKLSGIENGWVFLNIRPDKTKGGGQRVEVCDDRPIILEAAQGILGISERIGQEMRSSNVKGKKGRIEALKNERTEALREFNQLFQSVALVGIKESVGVYGSVQRLVLRNPGQNAKPKATLVAIRTKGRYEIDGEKIGRTVYSKDHEWALHLISGTNKEPARVWDLQENHVMCFVVDDDGYKILEGDLKPRTVKEEIGVEEDSERMGAPENGGTHEATSEASIPQPPPPVEKAVSSRKARREAAAAATQEEVKPSRRRERKSRRGEEE